MSDFKDGYRVGDVVTARVNGLIGDGVIIAIGKNEYAVQNHGGKVFVIEGKDILGLNKGYVATVEQSEDAVCIDAEKKKLKFPIAMHFDKHGIEVILKLKEDYDRLQYEAERILEFAKNMDCGQINTHMVAPSNESLEVIGRSLYDQAKKIAEQEQFIYDLQSAKV